jgi:DNA-binding protein H-NS
MSSLMMQDTPQLQQYRQIREQIAALEEQANQIAREVRKQALDHARALIREFDFTAEELQVVPKAARKSGGGSSASSSGAQVPPKYRDPASGATWTGRGVVPAWLRDKPNRDDYLIEKQEAAGTPSDTQSTPPEPKPDAAPNALTAQPAVWPFPKPSEERPALTTQTSNAA